jgi:molybdopterin-guanine dinucleotide biosynthesis protein A
MRDLEGFILIGGASSRMGEDKAQLRLGGRTFVERAAHALAAVAAATRVVSSRPEHARIGLPVVADVFQNAGALGGIHAALRACRAPWAAFVSCDLPFVTGEMLAHLAARREAGVEAVAPRQEDGRPQPLCALYARDACLPVAERMLRADERRPRALLAEVRTRWVEFAELSGLTGAENFFLNVNTPHDLAQAREIAEKRE